ncbi:helitron helicase-like domain-containing protein [Endozoicomonas gorgoniicola]|uniref:Helitron helicase-like domain-containing protein n=1 Tax=Endozoicomonas gorgoniicola TaxID=1234144 RepID=A0ABT3MPQ5_9GAMM|nr:helitron helicase-like domain-containing protein [Endozoicomonas gorgoniicola]MCW7551355.1 helitron helicase-like domain-containing protein [Endozoicomonas gorgoniicola]
MFLAATTWANGKTSRRTMSGDPLSLINVLMNFEDGMGRRDVRYSNKHKKWMIKDDDARVVPGLSSSFFYNRLQFDNAFYDGILDVDGECAIYGVVVHYRHAIEWNKRRAPHQIVVGFQLVNLLDPSNLFIQITNWENDEQHVSYYYCDPGTSADCPLLGEAGSQVDGQTEEEADSMPAAYDNESFEFDKDDWPDPPGAAGCSGFMISSGS